MNELENEIVAVIPNYKTPDLIARCVNSFRTYYPNIKLILIDNSKYDISSKWIYQFAEEDQNTTCLFNTFNMHHGPSMDTGIKLSPLPLVFIIDSDVVITKPNLIEDMYKVIATTKDWLAIGWITPINHKGFDVPRNKPHIPYCSPQCMIVNKETYLQYPPFIKHGAPCINTMKHIKIHKLDHQLIHFNWKEYAAHLRGGTQKRFGLDGNGAQKIPPFI